MKYIMYFRYIHLALKVVTAGGSHKSSFDEYMKMINFEIALIIWTTQFTAVQFYTHL